LKGVGNHVTVILTIGDEHLLVRVRTASYAVPGGFPILVTHVGTCGNQACDDMLIRCIRSAEPKVMSELVRAAKAAMAVMGCTQVSRINKDNSAGILYDGHSQDSSFPVWSETRGCTLGTGSLVGERLMEGAQGTHADETAITVGWISQFSSSWPEDLTVAYSEKVLYKGMKLDSSSDEDYVPSSIVVNDVAMSPGDNKTTEVNGLGDSHHSSASSGITMGTRASLQSTMPYFISVMQDILCALAEYEVGSTLSNRPLELDSSDDADDNMDIVGESAQIVAPVELSADNKIKHLEDNMANDWDMFDRLRDTVEDLEIMISDLVKWKNNDIDNGCSRGSVKRQEQQKCTVDTKLAIPISSPAVVADPSWVPILVASCKDAPIVAPPITVPSATPGKRTPVKNTPVVQVVVSPQAPVTILRWPTYTASDEGRASASFASGAAKNASADGYKVVAGCKRFVRKSPTNTQKAITAIPARQRHLSVRFTRECATKFVLPQGITVGRIRECLNSTLFALNCGAYFSVASATK